jgi:hypothetical protein
LTPVSYKYIDGTSDRTHTGFIAQDCENVFCDNWAGFVKNDNDEYGLRYDEFTSINTRAIQELNIIIQQQNNQIQEQNNQIQQLNNQIQEQNNQIQEQNNQIQEQNITIDSLLDRITKLEKIFI